MNFRDYLLRQNQSATTATINENSLHQFLRWCEDQHLESEQATYGDVLAYIKLLQGRNLQQRTIQLNLNSLNHYFKWLISIGVRADHPGEGLAIKGIKRRTLYHIIPMAELEALYGKFPGNEAYLSGQYRIWHKQNHHSSKIEQIVYGLMIWQGLDNGDIERLQVEDLKLREGTIYIRGTRRSNERTLELKPIQIMDLLDYLHHIRPEYVKPGKLQTDQLLVTTKSRPVGNGFLHCLLQELKALHPQITTANQIRTCIITHWLKQYNLRQVQYMAGHRYVSSTEAYQINDMEDLKTDIDKFHPFN